MKRRLAAILAADVVGYSRLMGADEAGTFLRVMWCLDRVVRPGIERHGGRIFKLMGDGVLAEFPSVRAAVIAAVEIQQGMPVFAEEEADEAERDAPEPLRLRIGINLGDLIAVGEDLYGDGVNVAARVESLAEPGGVCITRPVRDQIRDRLGYQLEDMGSISVKNIARPVRVFRVVIDATTPTAVDAEAPRRSLLGGALRVGALAGAAVLASGIWTSLDSPPAPPAPPLLADRNTAPTDPTPPAASAEEPARRVEVAPLDDPLTPTDLAAIALESAGGPAAPAPQDDSISIALSFDVNPGAWPSCAIFGGFERHTLPLNAGGDWTPITMQRGPELDLLAKARRDEDEVVLTLLPYSGVWREEDALRIRLPDASPGATARAFSAKRAMPPLTPCGRLVAYVNVVE